MNWSRIVLVAGLAGAATGAAGVVAASQATQIALGVESKEKVFVCGEDEKTPPIPLRRGMVILAGDSRLYVPCPETMKHTVDHRELREETVLRAALASRDPELQWRAVQAMVRLGLDVGTLVRGSRISPICNAEAQIFGGVEDAERWQPGQLFRLVRHPNSLVRLEAAYGIGLALSRPGIHANAAAAARREIEACLLLQTEPAVEALLLEAIGVARYGSDEQRAPAESYLLQKTRATSIEVVLGAVKGLEALIRSAPKRPVSDEALERLRDLAVREPPGTAPNQTEIAARIRRLAVAALQAARDNDLVTLDRAANDRDWQVRRLVAMQLNLADEAHARIGARLAQDQSFQVRYDYLGSVGRLITRTRQCAPLVPYFEDVEPTVVLRALDLVNGQCTDLDDTLERVIEQADRILKTESTDSWHVPSRALSALARARPAEAKKRLPAALKHEAWQVRAAAAVSASNIGEMGQVIQLANDPAPNVQTAAIEALARLKDPAVVDPAIRILQHGSDFQLLRAAALAMTNVPEDKRDAATEALLTAMRRLTALNEDPSRDPRVAIVSALGRIMRPERSTDLQAFTGDLDDTVNEAVAKALQNLIGTEPVQRPKDQKRRYPFQPTEGEVSIAQPLRFLIAFDRGTVEIVTNPSAAPVTIARFRALVNRGYYDGLTFHRIVPNFVVQGGSPGANEYVGTVRYMRDEPSPVAPHLRGAVGISTRGRDTGDAQIFINLVDLPRLDRDYTVFAYVDKGMEIIDRLLEGAVIKSITLVK